MNQIHLKHYLDIIKELLTCPRGEEWVHLKQHEDWVNPEFVQVMEQVATQLAHEGDREAARFLHNWAAKLHHILIKEVPPPDPEQDKTQAYLALIQALLDCPEGAEDDLLSEHQDLIGPGLVHQMHRVAQRLKQQGADETAAYLNKLATELNQAWIEAHSFQPSLQKETEKEPQHGVDHASFRSNTTKANETELVSPEGNLKTVKLSPQQQSSNSAQTPLTTSLQLKVNQQLANSLSEIAQALHQLQQMLATPNLTDPALANPLWYMDVLERAYASKWLLTTDEVEHLIGVKPRCHGQEKIYQRGIWQFFKVGRLGTQTAWQISKTPLEALPSDEQHSNNGYSDNGQLKENLPISDTGQELEASDDEDVWA